MSFHTDNEKLLGKYKAFWTKIEDLKNIESNALPVFDNRYIKIKIRTQVIKFYINFHGLNVSEVNLLQLILLILYLYRKQFLPANTFRQLCLKNCKQTNHKLS